MVPRKVGGDASNERNGYVEAAKASARQMVKQIDAALTGPVQADLFA
jgi:hypothetical protein